MHPADDAVHAIVGRLRRTDWSSIETAAIAALRRDRTATSGPDGYGSRASGNGGGIRASTPSSSTEIAAMALCAGGTPDEHHRLTADAVEALEAAARGAASATAALRRVDAIAARPAQRYVPSGCAEPHCEDAVGSGRKGRCEACYRWRYEEAKRRDVEWAEIGPVPRRVIEERNALRDRRRVHVNGPLAGR